MRRWTVRGGVLAMDEAAVPVPGPGEVRVAMKAAAINARDIGIQAGFYPSTAGVLALSDGAGVVEALGEGVTEWAVGDAVVTCFYPYWESGPANALNHRASLGCEVDGVLAEHVIVQASGLVAKPRTLDLAEAATLPCAALTAWTALFTEGQLKPGQHVLIQGTGGVASFALMFAKLAGAEVTVISSSDTRLEQARAMGADHGINYATTPDWEAPVLAQTGGRGVDLVIELGGAATLTKSTMCVAVGGRICVIGLLGGPVATFPVVNLLARHIAINGITVGHREDFRAMNAAIDAAGLKPMIAARFGFGEADAAYATLAAGGQFGKVVVEF